ncbi:MAG: HD domain-containing protein [Actinomycetota bacterium]|nr:HD domain-containing protein [Actinomycetota bacterium]
MIPGTTDTVESAATQKLIEVMWLRDRALADHGLRAAHMAAAIASELGCSSDEVDRTYLGGLLHDIGKLGIPEAILWKPAGLDATEWKTVRDHPQDGHRLVVDLTHREVAAAVLYHHERFDGEGYPHRVDLASMPLTVRIVQVADAYDAITSDRPYEPPLPASVAVAEINRCAGTQFDPDVARGLSSLLEARLDGQMIKLPGSSDAKQADPFEPMARWPEAG